MNRYLIFILVLILVGCRSQYLDKEVKCDEFLSKHADMTNCEKIVFLKNNFNENKISSRCFDIVVSDLEKSTDIKSKSRRGFAGVIYDNEEDFSHDIQKWEDSIGCNQ